LTSKWIDQEGPFYFGVSENGGKDWIIPLKLQGRSLQESDVIDAVNDFACTPRYHYSDELWYEVTGSNTNTLILGSNYKPTDQTSVSSATSAALYRENEASVSLSPATPTRVIRSYETDLIVKVGSGETAKEFPCHLAILSFASTKLDSLIGKASGELLLPHLNPDHWHMFYQYISPDNNCWGFSAEYDHSNSMEQDEKIKVLCPFRRIRHAEIPRSLNRSHARFCD
jgi:hypothetical protein